MKHSSYLVPEFPRPATPHAKACMEKIREILSRPSAFKKIEDRQPGEDLEEDNEPM